MASGGGKDYGHTKRGGWHWEQRVKRAKRRARHDPRLGICWICGLPIDLDLPSKDRGAFTLDHLVPLARGGMVDGEALPAHRGCNSSRGDGRRSKRSRQPTTLLDW